jgi:hypothetical protein
MAEMGNEGRTHGGESGIFLKKSWSSQNNKEASEWLKTLSLIFKGLINTQYQLYKAQI